MSLSSLRSTITALAIADPGPEEDLPDVPHDQPAVTRRGDLWLLGPSGVPRHPKSAKSEIWLPFLDTYRTMCLAPQPDFRRVLAGVRVELAA
jgi:hypothetical protein